VASGNELHLWAVVLSPDGAQRLFAEAHDTLETAAALGENVARQLRELGASDLMAM
jgi:porphobilinogen deaminase